MKTVLKIILPVAVTFLLSGCKGDKSDGESNAVTPSSQFSNVRVVLDAQVQHDDTFQLFYTEDGTMDFKEELSVRTSLKGSTSSQQVVFELPEDLIFTHLRIDLGENPKQSDIKINGFSIDYFGEKLETRGNGIFLYFWPNEQIELDYANSSLKPKPSDGVYDPVLYPQQPLVAELEKLVR